MSDTRQKLIHITGQMIAQKGIDAVSMRELGKEMNLSRSAMYRHFRNKEDLLAAVVAENFKVLHSNMRQLPGNVSDPRQRLNTILRTYFEFGINNYEHYRLMFQKQWDKAQYPDIYASAIVVYELVESCLKQAGNTRKSPNQSTAIMFAFMHGLVELHAADHSEAEKGLNEPIELIESFLDMVFV
ncbi:TetR/AcrR family transcriptional regulator [Brevibacillus fulvus]|uniref:AcrR family transcriptional regulator n=1 Tax=Brevibacillus fulvus TaxID=1125967 RepID=A0A938XZ01_9BACL|nr:TetR/AcrR family transcriptional regulator [Brevibacillus fulvus]MBM7590396.1 AcrR family transcriptional regulator [Brevibacillus fulvus]